MKPSQISQSLRQIAAKIDNSKQPDRRLVAAALKKVIVAMSGAFSVAFTDDSQMGAQAEGDFKSATREQIISYLNQSPRNAVVINVGTAVGFEDAEKIAVFCGAAESPDNYFYQALPLEEPDADGGDLTAEQAVDEVLAMAAM